MPRWWTGTEAGSMVCTAEDCLLARGDVVEYLAETDLRPCLGRIAGLERCRYCSVQKRQLCIRSPGEFGPVICVRSVNGNSRGTRATFGPLAGFIAELTASQERINAISWTKDLTSRGLALLDRSWLSLASKLGC